MWETGESFSKHFSEARRSFSPQFAYAPGESIQIWRSNESLSRHFSEAGRSLSTQLACVPGQSISIWGRSESLSRHFSEAGRSFSPQLAHVWRNEPLACVTPQFGEMQSFWQGVGQSQIEIF
jgi:hypothetical protein